MESSLNLKTYKIPRIRYSLIRESYVESPIEKVQNSRDLVGFLHTQLDDWDREVFLVIHLDSKNQIIDICTASIGSLSTSITHPREIWCYAVRNQSAAVIFVHNHPSGEATPSHEDKDCTDRLVKAGQILGIRVLDHLIIGAYGNFFSFADSGLLKSSS